MLKSALGIAVFGLCLMLSACGPETDAPADSVASASFASSSTWPYPVPTGCVSISSTQCRTNVGHYDVVEAEASLDANMAAAGYTKGYSATCRSNLGYSKGKTRVCYRVGIVENSNFQAIGSQWNGFRG